MLLAGKQSNDKSPWQLHHVSIVKEKARKN
jgi:hypothetical protein